MFRRLRYRKWLVAGIAVAAFVVPATALAGNVPTLVDGRSPDTVDAALAAQPKVDPAASKYLLRYGYTRSQIAAMLASSTPAYTVQPTLVDGRSPDTIDFAAQAHSPVVTVVREPGFQWGDFGIGGGAALAAMILLGLAVRFATNRQNRGGQRPVTIS